MSFVAKNTRKKCKRNRALEWETVTELLWKPKRLWTTNTLHVLTHYCNAVVILAMHQRLIWMGVTNHWTEVDWTGMDSQKCQKYVNKPLETKLSTHKNQTQWNIEFLGLLNPCPAISMGVWWLECACCLLRVASGLATRAKPTALLALSV